MLISSQLIPSFSILASMSSHMLTDRSCFMEWKQISCNPAGLSTLAESHWNLSDSGCRASFQIWCDCLEFKGHLGDIPHSWSVFALSWYSNSTWCELTWRVTFNPSGACMRRDSGFNDVGNGPAVDKYLISKTGQKKGEKNKLCDFFLKCSEYFSFKASFRLLIAWPKHCVPP